MRTYIAYFDVLGFKEFMANNDEAYFHQHIDHLFRESQNAVAKGQLTESRHRGTLIPDLTEAEVNCMHISDSIIFWTVDQSELSFRNIVDVCYSFYWRSIQAAFPMRGCLVAGDISFHPFQVKSKTGATFYNSSIFGQGLVDAYVKAESQNWAGCFIDTSAIESVPEELIEALTQEHKIIQYPVPLKTGETSNEYAVCIMGGSINQETFDNLAPQIANLFTQHMNGQAIAESVQVKMDNTLAFLHSFIAPV
jgi:hypothetical protein